MASEDVLEAARNHAADFGRFDRACREYHLAEAHLIASLAAEIRKLRTENADLKNQVQTMLRNRPGD